jgi:hypothetical protein
MGVISGTIIAVEHLRNPSRIGSFQGAIVSVTFPAYTASTDSFSIAGVGAAIETAAKRGKTNTIKAAIVLSPGTDATGTDIYPCHTTVAGALTVSTDALTGGLKAADLSTEASVDSGGMTVPARILVVYSEA